MPTIELEEELVRRANGEWRESPSRPIPHCDDCDHFTTFKGDPDGMPKNYNPCELGHEMRFRVPHTMGDVHAGNWGYYRRGCRDRRVAA